MEQRICMVRPRNTIHLVCWRLHSRDYPWGDLGNATVVDVGGGFGGFDIQLSHLYPDLKFVVQDRGPVIQQAARTVWAKEAPQALAKGRVSFVEHDFFEPNPVQGADIYWLRYIMQVTYTTTPTSLLSTN